MDPGSEWRLHRHWFTSSAMADLLEADFGLAEKDTLYRCLDKLLPHKDALMLFLKQRWGELFGASFDVLLYDLTSTYFEADTPRQARRLSASRDRPDRHPGRLSLELRSAGRQHRGLHHAVRSAQAHRDPIRQSQSNLGHGPRHPNGRDAGANARDGGLLPSGHAQGAIE